MTKKRHAEEELPTAKKSQPMHYKIVCISMYTEDLDELDKKVEALKKKGNYKANRSALIRYALSLVEVDDVPSGILR